MTAFTSLLSLKEISQDTLCIYISILQASKPSGAIHEDPETIKKHYNKTFSKRKSTDEIKRAIDQLVEKGVMPSRQTVYPFASQNGHSKNVDEILEKLEQDMSDVRPVAADFPDQTRIFAALKMANVLEIAVTEKTVRVTGDDEALVVNSDQKTIDKKEWDYSLIGKMKNAYGTETIIDTICEIHLHNGFDQFDKYDFIYRREKCREYLFGALEGENQPAQDSKESVLTY